jgi:hypothetical protein
MLRANHSAAVLLAPLSAALALAFTPCLAAAQGHSVDPMASRAPTWFDGNPAATRNTVIALELNRLLAASLSETEENRREAWGRMREDARPGAPDGCPDARTAFDQLSRRYAAGAPGATAKAHATVLRVDQSGHEGATEARVRIVTPAGVVVEDDILVVSVQGEERVFSIEGLGDLACRAAKHDGAVNRRGRV